MDTREKGTKGEDIAREYLENKGYKFIASNFFASRSGEIDLIMRDEDYIVFVEVKSLSNKSSYTIFESLTRTKKRRLKYSINRWLIKKKKENSIWRVDFVGIIINKKAVQSIDHFEFIDLS